MCTSDRGLGLNTGAIHRVKLRQGESLWSRYDHHFVGITRYNALS